MTRSRAAKTPNPSRRARNIAIGKCKRKAPSAATQAISICDLVERYGLTRNDIRSAFSEKQRNFLKQAKTRLEAL